MNIPLNKITHNHVLIWITLHTATVPTIPFSYLCPERKFRKLTYTYTFLVITHIFLNSKRIENCTAFYSPDFAKFWKGLCYQVKTLLIHHFCSKSGQWIIQFQGRTLQAIKNEETGQNHKTIGSIWIDWYGPRSKEHWIPQKRTDNTYLIIQIGQNEIKLFDPEYKTANKQYSPWPKEQIMLNWKLNKKVSNRAHSIIETVHNKIEQCSPKRIIKLNNLVVDTENMFDQETNGIWTQDLIAFGARTESLLASGQNSIWVQDRITFGQGLNLNWVWDRIEFGSGTE